ncbi:MAG: WG repeat-containing protein, partial [Saprospiraceae bacterium]|nr:WG repeat-containing protein [Saprospiraceae bacterium]
LLAAKNGFWGLIDPAGRTVEPFEWTEAMYYHQTDSLVLLSKPGLQRLLDRQGKTVVETRFDRWETSGGIDRKKFIYARQNGKAGLVDFQNKVVLPFEFENIMWVEDKVVCIFKDNRYGLVTLDGRPILPVEYGIIHSHYAHGLFGVNTPDAQKRGLVDSTGVFILPIEYAQVNLIAGRSLIAAKNMDAKIAIFDLRGKQLTDFLFEFINSRDDVPGLFFGQIGPQQFRLLNGKGEFLSPEVFESVSTSPTAFTASVGWKNAFFRLDGKQVTEFKYYGGMGFDTLINRDRMINTYRLPKDRTWIGRVHSNGRDLYIDSEGNEFDPLGK